VEAQRLVIRRQNQKQQQLLDEKDKLLSEKDLLMLEIHHRVKNNLNIIISLLESQSRYLNNPAAQAALRDTQNRVHAVVLLHQKLYGATAGTEVDASLYITELISHLSETFATRNNGITITQKIDPVPVSIDASEMLPLAVIINEAVTNGIKHAFPDGRKGHIHLLVNKYASGAVLLQVRDNGVGLPFQLRPDHDHSLGLSLINGLVAQVHGSWTIENDGGVVVTVKFPCHSAIEHSEQETISSAV
jgi:two-component sensor histidine kinase